MAGFNLDCSECSWTIFIYLKKRHQKNVFCNLPTDLLVSLRYFSLCNNVKSTDKPVHHCFNCNTFITDTGKIQKRFPPSPSLHRLIIPQLMNPKRTHSSFLNSSMLPWRSAWRPFSGGTPSSPRSRVPPPRPKCLESRERPRICGTLPGWCGRPACWRTVCRWPGLCTARPCGWQDRPPGRAAGDSTGRCVGRTPRRLRRRWTLCRCGSTGLPQAAGKE